MRIDSAIITGSFSVNGDTFNDLGAYTTTGSNTFVGNQSIVGAVSASALTGSISYTNLTDVPTLVSGSEQIVSILSPLNSFTASNSTTNTFTSSASERLTSLEIRTGSLATTGSNTFYGTQIFSGSLFVQDNLVVQGSSSLQNITASAVSIGTNTVVLNTANPSIRFGGLSVVDSGSVAGKSGSLYFDSTDDEWIFIHQGNTAVTSSIMITGPETYDNVGNETRLTTNIIPKIQSGFHIVDSCIIDNGTTTCIKNNLIGTGTICSAGAICGLTINSNGVVSGNDFYNGISYPYSTNFGSGADASVTTLRAGSTNGYQSCITIQGGNVGGGVLVSTSSNQRLNITSTGIACFSCQICTPLLKSSAIDLNPSLNCPSHAGVAYGIFGLSGVGLGITSGATGAGQGISFFTCGDYERIRIISNGTICLGPIAVVGFQGGSDTTVITGGSGQGSLIRNYYATGGINNELRGNGDNYFNNVTGNTIIGGSSPSNKLSVRGNTDFGATGYGYSGPSQYGALMFPRGQVLFSNTNSQNQLYLSSNAYTNASGVFAFRNSAQPATFIGQDNGGISFGIAPSGTADATINWCTPLSITPTGNVVINTANSGVPLTVARTLGTANIKAGADNSGYMIIDSCSNSTGLNHYVAYDVWLASGGGNVGLRTSSPSYQIHGVGCTYFQTSCVKMVGGQNYNENIRTYAQGNGYSSYIMGAISGDSASGTGQWSLVRWPVANGYQFTIRYADTDYFYLYSNGNYSFYGSNVSDARKKTNIEYIENNQLDNIMKLKPATFNKLGSVMYGDVCETHTNGNTHTGFIAQDVIAAGIPNILTGGEDEGYGLDYDGILSLVVKSMQEQQCIICSQSSIIHTLKSCLGIN